MRLAALLVAALWLSGCVTPPGPPDAGVPLPGDDPRPARLVDELAERAQGRRSLRGVVRLSVDAEDVSLRTTQRILALRPSRLRVEVMGLFGQVAAVLTTDGHTYQYAQSGGPGIQSGFVTPDLLWQIARVDLVPEDAVGLLLGAPVKPDDRVAAGARQLDDGEIRVRLEDGSGRARERLAFDPAGRLVGVEAWDEHGVSAYEARFDEFRDQDGTAFADRVDLHFPRTGARAVVRFRGVELNPELAPRLFYLEGPERVSSGREERGGAIR
ncbi:MAG: hypothetical protein ACQGVK_23745 [Myxococcota bacterium]